MALQDVDYSGWQSWQRIDDPRTGRQFYVIPGYNNQYVFDPYESDATGTVQVYRNPKPIYDERAQAQAQEDEANSLTSQLAVPAGAVAGYGITRGVSNVVDGKPFFNFGGGATEAGTQAGNAVGQVSTAAGTAGANVAGGAGSVATPELIGASRVPITGGAGGGAGAFPAAGGVGNVAIGAAGAIGLGDVVLNEREGARGIIQGGVSGAALGAELGSLAGPAGVVPGAVIGGVVGAGAGVYNTFFGHETTQERQQKRASALAEKDPTFARYLNIAQNNGAEIDQINQRAHAATPPDYKGWWDDPDTPGVEWIWVNKLKPESTGGEVKHDSQYFSTLGSGDVMWHPWFFENVPGWGDLSFEERDQIASWALQNGNPHGNAGNIDFNDSPEFQSFTQGVLSGESVAPENHMATEAPQGYGVTPQSGQEVRPLPQIFPQLTDRLQSSAQPQSPSLFGGKPYEFPEQDRQMVSNIVNNQQELGRAKPFNLKLGS